MSHEAPHRQSSLIRNLVIGVVLLTCLRIWMGPSTMIASVQAQLPEPAEYRKLLLQEARRTNEFLSEITETLKSRTLKVQIIEADNMGVGPA